MSIKEDFKDWLRTRVDTLVPLSSYPNALAKLIPNKLISINENVYNDLFDCLDIEYLNELYKRLSNGGDLHKFNAETQNRVSSAAIKQYIEFLKSLNINSKIKHLKIKNIMLYGAPGVGKTYNYKKLVSLIESRKYSENDIFNKIIENQNLDIDIDEFFELIKKENRLEFVTFHQSYSYEDFIEGFRPQDDGNINLEDGIFKKICEKARVNLVDSKKEAIEIKQDINLVKSFENYAEYKIYNDEPVILKKGDEFKFTKFENKRLYFQTTDKSNYFKEFTLLYDDFKLIHNSTLPKKTLKDISIILNTNSVQQRYAYLLAIYNDYKEKEKNISISNELEQKIEQKNFYIVIDEINRGNISKIFGELITLIEEDKRDIYEVTLPYSKDDVKFTIPSNLYIIATMNSTDKSIATIDIALRRRFTFLKMKPNINLVPNEAKELFSKLNEFITNNLGEDYQLGHSYFMQNLDLKFVKEYKIKPLLEEYFYGDDEKYKKALDILNEKDNLL